MGARKLAIVMGVCFGILGAAPGHAQQLHDKIVYNPGTKSYFEVKDIASVRFLMARADIKVAEWRDADKIAEKLTYKDTHGRLAVVKDLETHDFILKNFLPYDDAWIGLRYWCATKRLQFNDGTFWQPGGFHAWAETWNQGGALSCMEWNTYGIPQYMPVAYNPVSEGFRWIAKEWHKGYALMIVEYPTGHP